MRMKNRCLTIIGIGAKRIIGGIMEKHISILFTKSSRNLDLTTQQVLYEQYNALVFRSVYSYCPDPYAVKDIVQETFIRAFVYYSTFEKKENSSFEAWLVTIAKNETFKYMQKQAKYNELVEDINQVESSSIENEVITKLAIEEIHSALKHLPALSRDIFLLRFMQSLSFKEIGQKLGIDESVARQRVFRIKKLIHRSILPISENVS